MSSSLEGRAEIAGAVVSTVAIAGWAAWKAGTFAIQGSAAAINAVNQAVADKKQLLEETQARRRKNALMAHNSLLELCRHTLSEMESSGSAAFQTAEICCRLRELMAASIPEETELLESQNILGFFKVRQLNQAGRQALSSCTGESGNHIAEDIATADLLDDQQIVLSAIHIHQMHFQDVACADPLTLERAELRGTLQQTAGEIMEILQNLNAFSVKYGLIASSDTWLRNFFSDTDQTLVSLSRPDIEVVSLKEGLRHLQENMEYFRTFWPTLEKEQLKFCSLYAIYRKVSKSLREPVAAPGAFPDLHSLEQRLEQLRTREKKAEKCARIYRQLGRAGYLCYAWDQELARIGYNVHSKSEISKLTDMNIEHACIDRKKMPFYCWDRENFAQFYSIARQCDLQVVIHSDGSVSLQTIALEGSEHDIQQQQSQHCKKMEELRRRLKENWFIDSHCSEVHTAEEVITASDWRQENCTGGSHQAIPSRQKADTVGKYMREES